MSLHSTRLGMHFSLAMFPKVKALVLFLFLTFCFLELLVRLLPLERKNVEIFQMDLTNEAKTVPWYEDLKDDHDHLRRNFQAYEIYRLEPYSGKHIHITQEGYRKTENATRALASVSGAGTRIGIFGGSTMWGGWARGGYTAASHLAKELANRFPATGVEVINYGEVGFVFSQEIHRAVRVFYSDAPLDNPYPKFMIFVDGVNDVLSSITNFGHGTDNPAGLPWEYEKYRYLFQLGNTGEVSAMDILKKFKTVRMVLKLMAQLGLKKADERGFWREPTEKQLDGVGTEVARKYIRMVGVADTLLKSKGVTPLFILQPVMAFKNTLTTDENAVYEKNLRWQPYLIHTYEKIRRMAKGLPAAIRFYDWSGMFAGSNTTLYADVIHYSEAGNGTIGARLAELLSVHFTKELTRNN